MSTHKERVLKGVEMFQLADTYLSEEQSSIIAQTEKRYEELVQEAKSEGLNRPSAEEVIDSIEGGREAWDEWNWVLKGLDLSSNFD